MLWTGFKPIQRCNIQLGQWGFLRALLSVNGIQTYSKMSLPAEWGFHTLHLYLTGFKPIRRCNSQLSGECYTLHLTWTGFKRWCIRKLGWVESFTCSPWTWFKSIRRCAIPSWVESFTRSISLERDSNPFEKAFSSWVESFTCFTSLGRDSNTRQLSGDSHTLH